MALPTKPRTKPVWPVAAYRAQQWKALTPWYNVVRRMTGAA
jgi:hypothetical protein